MVSLMQITLLSVLRERWELKMSRMAGASCADSCTAKMRICKSVCRCWFFLGKEILLFRNRLDVKNTASDGSWKTWVVLELLNVSSVVDEVYFYF